MSDANLQPRVAVVGVGYWGRNLARNFAELGALAAIVDTHAPSADEVARATGAPIATLEAVLADATITGVVIATRAETHYGVAARALAARKHVFVEKPLVLDETEADVLIAQAEAAGRVLMVGHLLRYHPLFERMRQLVQSGEFGRLRYVYSDRMSFGKIRTEEDVLWSFAPHDISVVLALAGEEPHTVTAQGQTVINPTIRDIATLQLAFPSGVRADIRASWLHYRKVQQIVALCDTATICFVDSEPEWSRKLSIHRHDIAVENEVPVPKRGETNFIDMPQCEPLRSECAHFLQSIVDGTAPLTDGAEGRAVLRVLDRASRAFARDREELRR